MLTTFREKSQVTLPKEIVAMSGLQKGDNLNVEFIDGKIVITPVILIDKNLFPDGINPDFIAQVNAVLDMHDETMKGLKDR